MVRRWFLALAGACAMATASGAAMAGWWEVAPDYFVTPPPGPVHVLHPSFMRPYGIPPRHLGITYRRVRVSDICRVDDGPGGRCFLSGREPIGTPCGCPPLEPGASWAHGIVAKR